MKAKFENGIGLSTYLPMGDKVVIRANGKKVAEIRSDGTVKKFNQKHFKQQNTLSLKNIDAFVKRRKK